MLLSFLNALFAEGRVRVPSWGEIDAQELCAAERLLAEIEGQHRPAWPGSPPRLAVEPARWAAVLFFRACQFVAFRDLGEQAIQQTFQPECPGEDSAATHYSVDLTFRYLPDLLRLARTPAEGDPLIEHLRHWADRWPLSSVGIAGAQPVNVDAVVDHPSLLGMYADRIIARGDLSRLGDLRVRQRVAESLGGFPELAPPVAAALQSSTATKNEEQGDSP